MHGRGQLQSTVRFSEFREEISQKRMNSIRGIDNHERLDEELYQDFETDEARKV